MMIMIVLSSWCLLRGFSGQRSLKCWECCLTHSRHMTFTITSFMVIRTYIPSLDSSCVLHTVLNLGLTTSQVQVSVSLFTRWERAVLSAPCRDCSTIPVSKQIGLKIYDRFSLRRRAWDRANQTAIYCWGCCLFPSFLTPLENKACEMCLC